MTIGCAPPSDLGMRVIALFVVLLLVPGSAFAEANPERFWLSASGGVGAGTQRHGAMDVVAKLDGYVWLHDGFGLVATATRHHASELGAAPTMQAVDSSVIAGGAAFRIDLDRIEGIPHHLHVAGLLGRDQEHGLAWMARMGMHRRHGTMLLSVDLVGYGSEGAGASWITTVGVGVVL